jgi:DNA primase catalytic core
MARIPEVEIERLKQDVSLVRLVEAKGIELKRHGADLLGLCPFHDDREPSLVISPKKNLWHCLGACQAGGSVIDWVMRAEGVSFRHAVELLKEGSPALATREGTAKRSTIRALPAPVTPDADDQALLDQVVGYYHETLKASPEALAYLKTRGIDHPEAIERFRLGFANRTLGLRLPDKRRKEGAEIRGRLEKLGLYRDSGHEHFNGSLVIPVSDEAGQVSGLYGRKINDALRAGTPKHLYLPGPHKGVWNVEALQASKEIILCEALIDALTFWCAGYRNVTSSYGVEGFTDDHLAALKRYSTKRVLIAYDRDEAGDRAADKLAERLLVEGIECWRIQFPKGMDANEYALKVTPAAKSLGIVIRKAQWMGQGAAPTRASEILPVAPAALEITNCDLKSEPQIDVESAPPLAAHEPTATEPALPASPVPPAPALEIPAEVRDQETVLAFGERRYRVRGLHKNLSYELLKVNVMAACGERFHVDTLDLYAAKQRASYITQAAVELQIAEDILKADLGRVLLKLEQLQEAQIRKAVEPQPLETPQMSPEEREAALALLKSPDLLGRILTDFEACGIVGERTNKLVGYLAAVSRKLDAPLAVVIQSSSAAGKSSLMDAVLAMMPEEERVKYSAMTGQSLFYMGQTNLKHRILAIVEEEGASRASYALKLLQSEGELTIASTAKDPTTGNLVTQDYRVEGPVMIFLTTTAIQIDEELLNRCLVLSVDEDREQTKAIHRLQRTRRTLEGLLARQAREAILTLHRNAQRLLRPLAVVNPYAQQLTFLDDRTRTRRDHEKYLTLIDTIALLHQYQRGTKAVPRGDRLIEYVEATLHDIAIANQLAHEVLGRSLDELPPQTRRLLLRLDQLVTERSQAQALPRAEIRLTRREVREATGIGDTQLRVHLERLVALEYLLVHRGARGQSFIYELRYDGKGRDGAPFVPGLIDVQALLAAATTATSRGQAGQFAGASRPQRGANAGASRVDESAAAPASAPHSEESSAASPKLHGSRGNGQDRPYTQIRPLAAASR